MSKKPVICDRCKQAVINAYKDQYLTQGYYETEPNSYWSKFADKREYIICDECMFKDERYIAVYGRHSNG